MFVYYNVIWIIFLIILFATLFLVFKRKRTIRNQQVPHGHPSQFVVVDMNGRPPQQPTYPATYAPPPPPSSPQTPAQPTTQNFYRPPESTVEPPPPSYQDHSKDYHVQQIQ